MFATFGTYVLSHSFGLFHIEVLGSNTMTFFCDDATFLSETRHVQNTREKVLQPNHTLN